MRYASVCSGVEAASLAWMPLGWVPVWFSEIEPFPCAVLKHRYPDVTNLGDMTKLQRLPNGDMTNGTTTVIRGGIFDLLVGGTPCQDFSVAGKRTGLQGERSSLALTFIDLLEQCQPTYFVWENVPGALSTSRGRDFARLIQAFTDIGYGVAWRVLDAQWCRVDGYPYAIPQRRRRLFVVGCLGDPTGPAEILLEPEGVFRASPPKRIKTQGIAALAEADTGGTVNRFAESYGIGGAKMNSAYGVVTNASFLMGDTITDEVSGVLSVGHENGVFHK